MPKCAWSRIGAFTLLLNHSIGTAQTIALPFQFATWVIHTPAALVMVASLAAFHLLNHHPRHVRR